MKERFSADQVSRILDQSLAYQCACPAQVCRTLFELRELYDYQLHCGNRTDEDQQVHTTIAASTEQAHAVMEECLAQVLEIEGWDLATLAMPARLRERMPKPL
jgi:hypothetical protein